LVAVDCDGITVTVGEGAVRLVTVQLAGEPELPACAFALAAGLAPGARLGGVGGVSGIGGVSGMETPQ
jgi:hypothetical protein